MVEAPLQVQKCGHNGLQECGLSWRQRESNLDKVCRNSQTAGSRMFLEGSAINYGYLQDRVTTLSPQTR
jgi:hypothetical protein